MYQLIYVSISVAEYAENESKKDFFFFLLYALYSSDEQFYFKRVGDILKGFTNRIC